MKKYLVPFIVLWIIDSVLIYLSRLIYPHYFVLGGMYMSAWGAIITAGFTWTLLVWLIKPFVYLFAKLKGRLLMFGFYFLANFVALWLTARLSPITGFGVTRFTWLVILAIVADIIQYIVWKVGRFKKATK